MDQQQDKVLTENASNSNSTKELRYFAHKLVPNFDNRRKACNYSNGLRGYRKNNTSTFIRTIHQSES